MRGWGAQFVFVVCLAFITFANKTHMQQTSPITHIAHPSVSARTAPNPFVSTIINPTLPPPSHPQCGIEVCSTHTHTHNIPISTFGPHHFGSRFPAYSIVKRKTSARALSHAHRTATSLARYCVLYIKCT